MNESQKLAFENIKNILNSIDNDNAIDILQKINHSMRILNAEMQNSYFIGEAYMDKKSVEDIFNEDSEKSMYFTFNSVFNISKNSIKKEKFDAELEKIQNAIVSIIKLTRIEYSKTKDKK